MVALAVLALTLDVMLALMEGEPEQIRVRCGIMWPPTRWVRRDRRPHGGRARRQIATIDDPGALRSLPSGFDTLIWPRFGRL